MPAFAFYYANLKNAQEGSHILAQERQKDVYVYKSIYGRRGDQVEYSLKFLEDVLDQKSRNIVYMAPFIKNVKINKKHNDNAEIL